MLNDKTFPQYAQGLGHADKDCVAGVAKALAISNDYDTNKLLDLLGQDNVVKPALIEVLGIVRKRLNARGLRHAYDLEPREKAAVFKIIRDIASHDLVPDLVARVEARTPPFD
ncbi:MAG: hypothetical protein R3F24_03160 [Gammaproteobacteria bacterium]